MEFVTAHGDSPTPLICRFDAEYNHGGGANNNKIVCTPRRLLTPGFRRLTHSSCCRVPNNFHTLLA